MAKQREPFASKNVCDGIVNYYFCNNSVCHIG
jgi:hypothetical protein